MYKQNDAVYIFSVDYIFENGQPNMLQNALFHILRNKPKKIAVEGFNLYCSQRIYDKEYKKQNTIKQVADAFPEHNIISQYLFIKQLYDRHLFDCDCVMKTIMEKGVISYLKNMETIVNM